MKRGNLLLFLTLVFLASDCLAQSVADVARRERDRQRSAKSRVVATNYGTSGSTGTAPTPAPGTTTPAATPSAAKPSGPANTNERDEKYWRTAFQNARDNAKRAEARVELLDLKIKQLNTDMLQTSSFYNREYRLGPEIAAAQKELEDARKESDLAKKKISDLEEELRKSGGPAGWAR